MNYQETVILKESREYKAAEALTDSINSMSWNPKKFGLAVSMQHRTLQQSLMKSFVAILHVMATKITVTMTEIVAHMKPQRR